MAKITEKQLIEQIKMLKEIKPRKEWAVLLKSQILAEKQVKAVVLAQKVSIFDVISNFKFQISNSFSRKMAYSFAVIAFLIVGVFGFAQYTMPGDLLFPVKKIAEQSQASLIGQTQLKYDVANLNSRINDLAKVAKNGRTDNIPSAISEIDASASVLAKNLKNNSAQDSQTLNEISQTLNKTLADIPGTDLTESSGVQDLIYVVIIDYQKTTLTDDQKNILDEAKDLYNQGKYTDALEKILLVNK